MSQLMARTWRFSMPLSVGALLDQYEVCSTVKGILNAAHARLEVLGLELSLFLYDVPENGLVQISGHVHVKNKCNITAPTGYSVRFCLANLVTGLIKSILAVLPVMEERGQCPLDENHAKETDPRSRRLPPLHCPRRLGALNSEIRDNQRDLWAFANG